VTGLETKKSWNFEFGASQIMKSGFDCTNLKQINSRKLLKVLFSYVLKVLELRDLYSVRACVRPGSCPEASKISDSSKAVEHFRK